MLSLAVLPNTDSARVTELQADDVSLGTLSRRFILPYSVLTPPSACSQPTSSPRSSPVIRQRILVRRASTVRRAPHPDAQPYSHSTTLLALAEVSQRRFVLVASVSTPLLTPLRHAGHTYTRLETHDSLAVSLAGPPDCERDLRERRVRRPQSAMFLYFYSHHEDSY